MYVVSTTIYLLSSRGRIDRQGLDPEILHAVLAMTSLASCRELIRALEIWCEGLILHDLLL